MGVPLSRGQKKIRSVSELGGRGIKESPGERRMKRRRRTWSKRVMRHQQFPNEQSSGATFLPAVTI